MDRYLADELSQGPDETLQGSQSRKVYAAFDLGAVVLLALLNTGGGDAIRKITCIPSWRLCIYTRRSNPEELVMRRVASGRCPPSPRGYRMNVNTRAGVLLTVVHDKPKLWIPVRLRKGLTACRGKRFAVCTLGIYDRIITRSGHANALIFDVELQIIERYDPLGYGNDKYDVLLEVLLKLRLPDWDYVGTRAAAPRRGVQSRADAFDGMCVTYTFMYTLLRLLNPDRTSREINHYMTRGAVSELRTRALRLNRFMLDMRRGRAPRDDPSRLLSAFLVAHD